MPAILIQCPRTLADVPVGIETDQSSFEALPDNRSTMRCPSCGAEHVWSKTWARLAIEPQVALAPSLAGASPL